MEIGFVGAGWTDRPMAANLVAARYQVTGDDTDFEDGGLDTAAGAGHPRGEPKEKVVIRHIVTFVLKEGTTEEDIRAVEEALGQLPALIPELTSYQFGRDLGLNEGNGGFGATALVEKPDDVAAYLYHPEHLRISHEVLGPHVASKIAVQISVPDRC